LKVYCFFAEPWYNALGNKEMPKVSPEDRSQIGGKGSHGRVGGVSVAHVLSNQRIIPTIDRNNEKNDKTANTPHQAATL
jgi:hypothetical protein